MWASGVVKAQISEVDDRAKIDEAPRHGDVGQVHRPYVDGSYLQVFLQIF
jgi:hypothetical protein